MKECLVRFGIISACAFIASFFIERSVDISYIMLFGFIYYFSFPIDGYIMNKDFFAGYAGTLKATEENKNIRLFSFLLSTIVIVFVLLIIYYRYFVAPE